MTRPPDIVDYLRARLDEDHVAAVQYGKDIDRWRRETALHHEQGRICSCQGCITLSAAPPDPDRMLAEVAAKRAILDRHLRNHQLRREHPEDLVIAGALLESLAAVKLLAQPYAAHIHQEETRA